MRTSRLLLPIAILVASVLAAPAAAPAQSPKPVGSPAPAGLPRTGEADTTPMVLLALLGGLALVGAGAFVVWSRRSN